MFPGRKVLTLSFVFLILSISVSAQDRENLEKKKQETEKEIAITNKLLEETAANRKSSYNRLLILKKRISLRSNLIQTLTAEVDLLDREIHGKKENINKLEKELKKLKEEYAKLIYFAYKNRNSYDRLLFVLSAEDFNQAYRRMKYLQQYTSYRRNQARKIFNTQKALEYEIDELQLMRSDKQEVLQKKLREKNLLNLEQTRESKDILALKRREDELRRKLNEKIRIKNKLEKEIAALIEREAAKNTFYKDLNDFEANIDSRFRQQKGSLPWPVEEGVIIENFGEHWHPVLKGVRVNNEGIDIKVSGSTAVRAIFDGEIKRVFAIPGANISVIIRHGHYLTVYSNLVNVRVKTGDKIQASELLGNVFTSPGDEESGVLHLRVYEENKKLDPALWIDTNP